MARWIFGIVSWIIVLGLSFLAFYLGSDTTDYLDVEQKKAFVLAGSIIFAIALFVAFTVLVYILARIAYLSGKRFLKFVSEKSDFYAIVTSALVSALIFYATIGEFLQRLLFIIRPIFVNVPQDIVGLLTRSYQCSLQTKVDECLFYATNQGGSILKLYFDAIFFNIQQMPLLNLLLFFLIWPLLAIVLHNYTNRISARGWGFISYALISVFSLYLALSALLAVSLLKPTEPLEEVSAANLEQKLNSFKADFAPFERLAASTPTDVDKKAVIAEYLQKIKEVRKQNPVLNYTGFDDIILSQTTRDLDENEAELDARYDKLIAQAKSSSANYISEAVEVFRTESAVRIGARETSDHYIKIVRNFRERTDRLTGAIQDCASVLTRVGSKRSEMISLMNDYVASMQAIANKSTASDGDKAALTVMLDDLQNSGLINWARNYRSEDISRCDTPNGDVSQIPSRDKYGSKLGMIGAATTWLLASESMPVTLIVGLVGFGLIGALVSRFVRQDLPKSGAETLAETAIIIFSGFVAAIVVYVAAYGGIAIASAQGGDPNPYVVFAASLAGAVYSRDVWQKVRERLMSAK